MAYSIEVIRKENQKISKWSGGTTRELFIYPKDSVYSYGNFQWRLSSAMVDIEESVFTSLPGIDRIIMIIQGELLLKHEGHHTVNLKQYEQDSFSGEWRTRSFGKVKDFNLMTQKGSYGKLEVLHINENENIDIQWENQSDNLEIYSSKALGFYVTKGEVEVSFLADKQEVIHEGDLLLISASLKDKLPFMNIKNIGEKAEIIKAKVCWVE